MKSPVIFDITAVVIFSLVICCSSSDVTDESVFKEEGDVGKRPTAATVDNFRNGEGTKEHFDIVGSGGEDALFHGFTHEEIEKNRIITIDRDGNERVSTDEEVVQTLKRARHCNSTILRDEPHFSTQMKQRRNVIGPDNRFLRYITQLLPPYSAIGYLEPRGCTAYLVGPRHLITAAHCVHPYRKRQKVYSGSQLTFYLRRNCYSSRHGIRYGVSDVLVYSEYKHNGTSGYDLACLLLNSTVSNWMGFQYKDPMPTVFGEICGYPGDKKKSNSPSECFYCSNCSDVVGSGNHLMYSCDTEGGMSGSPVMEDDHDNSSHLYSYGVHTRGSVKRNAGVRITRHFFNDICRWKCDTGAHCSPLC